MGKGNSNICYACNKKNVSVVVGATLRSFSFISRYCTGNVFIYELAHIFSIVVNTILQGIFDQ